MIKRTIRLKQPDSELHLFHRYDAMVIKYDIYARDEWGLHHVHPNPNGGSEAITLRHVLVMLSEGLH